MRRIIQALFMTTLLGACTTPLSPAQSGDLLTHAWMRHPANAFFDEYGKPSAQFGQEGGEKIYSWNSRHARIVPADISHESSYEVADNYRGGADTHYCELRIYADSSDEIEKIFVIVDSTGRYGGSRCTEMFF